VGRARGTAVVPYELNVLTVVVRLVFVLIFVLMVLPL
jgi:hypothetical protein